MCKDKQMKREMSVGKWGNGCLWREMRNNQRSAKKLIRLYKDSVSFIPFKKMMLKKIASL